MSDEKRRLFKRILVVDDQPEITKILEQFLLSKKFEVKSVNSGKDAVTLCKSWQPQIVLLDLLMPEMDGFETLEKILEFNPEISVIMVTSLDDIEAGKRALNLGAVDYISKPLNFEYLEQTLLAKFNALYTDLD